MTTGIRGSGNHIVSWSGEDSPDPTRRRENTFIKSWTDDNIPTGYYYYVNSSGEWVWGGEGNLFTFSSNPNMWFLGSNDELNLQSRLLSSIKGYGLNMAVSAAEGKQTVDLIKTSSLSVLKAYKQVRKGHLTKAWTVLRDQNLRQGRRFARRPPRVSYTLDLSSAWLSVRYGWQPLLNDIYNALSFIESRAKKSEEDFTRLRASITRNRDASLVNPVGYRGSVTNRFTALAKVNTKWLSSFLTLETSGVMDPELVAWEILPFSFVIDWFLPVGTYLENRSAIPRLSVGYVLGKKTEGVLAGPFSGTDKPGYRIASIPANSSVHGSFQRVITTWPTPLPSFRNPFANMKHAVDAIGLWSQKGLR